MQELEPTAALAGVEVIIPALAAKEFIQDQPI
jgi:hypothetical protein